jgi:hypothetical protein
MKKSLVVIICLLSSGAVGPIAQEIDESYYPPVPMVLSEDFPGVYFETENGFLMKAFYPEYYADENNLRKDVRYVQRNDSALMATWDSLGYYVLVTLESLSGIEWVEKSLTIHLLRYLRVDGLYDPLALPIEGIRMEHYIEAAPSGLHQFLNLIKIIAGRNILQIKRSGYDSPSVSTHPLLDESAYRFDIVATTLALACAEQILPVDSLKDILNSEAWRRHNPGWEILKNHFLYSWILTPEQPLMFYLVNEPYDSPLIGLTRPPRIRRPESAKGRASEQVRLSAGVGSLGFSVARTPRGLLEVADIDTLGLAHMCGLMIGDKITRVNGEFVRNARELMAKILNDLESYGVYLLVLREDEEIGVLLLPPSEL